MQLPFGFAVPTVNWQPTPVSQLPSWADAKRICVDVETCDPDLDDMGPGVRRGSYICGIGFAIEDGPSHYLPIRHQGGDNLDPQHVLDYLRSQAGNFTGDIVGANLNYDLDFLYEENIRFPKVRWFRDVQCIDVLCCELYDRYSLDAIAERRGLPGKDESVLRAYAAAYKVHPKKEMYKLPGRAVAAYGVRDVQLPLAVLRKQEHQIQEEEIQSIVDLECKVTPILVDMRRRGVRVDLEKVQALGRKYTALGQKQLQHARTLGAGEVRFDQVLNADVMGKALEQAGWKVPRNPPSGKKMKESFSVTGEHMEKCGDVGKALARARDYSKMNQFVARTLEHAITRGGESRVHCTFHQLRTTKESGEAKGARYGRCSSEDYNFQQEPGRDDEFANEWRSVYIADRGARLASSDWSQQEPRIGVHYAEVLRLPGAHDFANEYRRNPDLDIHQMLADVSGMPRKIVKNYVNGRLYGMGDAKLCRQLGQPTRWVNRYGRSMEVPGEEGQKMIDQFSSRVPWLTMLVKEASKQAEKIGHVWTILRRKCRFPRDAQGNVDWTHKAFSRVGQGGAADQMKFTLVAVESEGIPINGIIHDEFLFNFEDELKARRVRELQKTAVRFSVPMKVDLEVGDNWGYMAKLEEAA